MRFNNKKLSFSLCCVLFVAGFSLSACSAPRSAASSAPEEGTGYHDHEQPVSYSYNDRPKSGSRPYPVETVAVQALPAPVIAPVTPRPVPESANRSKSLNGLSDGFYGYTSPRQMDVHKAERFTLRVSRSRAGIHTESITAIGHGPVVSKETTHLTAYVRANLSGGSDFDVSPLQDGAASIEIPASGYREWQWDITPRHGGVGTLRLIIYALASGGSPDQTIADIPIPVHISNVEAFRDYLIDHPEFGYLFTAGVLSLVLPFVTRQFRNKAQSQANPSKVDLLPVGDESKGVAAENASAPTPATASAGDATPQPPHIVEVPSSTLDSGKEKR